VDVYAFGDYPDGEEDGARADDDNIDRDDYYNAFLGILSAVRGGEVKEMPASSALGCLHEEARAIDMIGEEDNNNDPAAGRRGRQFYTMLQDIQDPSFRGIGLLCQEEIDAISKIQKKEDADVTANIQGREINVSSTYARRP